MDITFSVMFFIVIVLHQIYYKGASVKGPYRQFLGNLCLPSFRPFFTKSSLFDGT